MGVVPNDVAIHVFRIVLGGFPPQDVLASVPDYVVRTVAEVDAYFGTGEFGRTIFGKGLLTNDSRCTLGVAIVSPLLAIESRF